MQYSTYLPVFNGFYNTQQQFDYDFINEDIKQIRIDKYGKHTTFDNIPEIDIDYSSYEHDIVKNVIVEIKELLSDFVLDIEFEKIVSPKEYNFKNDSVNVKITANEKNIADFIYSNKEKFCLFLKKRYTSCDGFISHYNNDFESWEVDTKNFSDFSINEHCLGSILDFIAKVLDIDNYKIYEDVIENVCALNYIINYDDVLKPDDTLLNEFLKNGYTFEIANYYITTLENGNIDKILVDEKTLSIINQYTKKAV